MKRGRGRPGTRFVASPRSLHRFSVLEPPNRPPAQTPDAPTYPSPAAPPEMAPLDRPLVGPPASRFPTLRDAWPMAHPFTLNGVFERNGFTPIWTALLVFVSTFLVYQIVGGIAAAVVIVSDLASSGEVPDVGDALEALAEHAGPFLAGNALGQWIGFGLLTLLAARWHTRTWRPFLRLRMPDGPGLGLAVLGFAALVLPVQWLGNLNRSLPQPDWLREFEQTQVELIEKALLGADLGPLFLLFTVALTPALCEELLFRGYFQRQVERKWGAVVSIVLVGLFFGLYHMRLSQVVPLALLGTYLGYAVWATGSLWTGVLVHLLNNGLAVLVAVYVRDHPTLTMEEIESATVPWYLALPSLLAVAGLCVLMHRRREVVTGGRPDAAPVADLPSPDPPSVLAPS